MSKQINAKVGAMALIIAVFLATTLITTLLFFKHANLSGGNIVLLGVFPWVVFGLMLLIRKKFSWKEMGGAYLLCAYAAGLIGEYSRLDNAYLINVSDFTLPCLFIACVITMVISYLEPEFRKSKLLLLVILPVISAYYVFGFLAEVNQRLDDAPAQAIEVVVKSKIESRSTYRGGVTRPRLILSPWRGAGETERNIAVSQEVYNLANTGSVVCISVHSGALRSPWFSVGACR